MERHLAALEASDADARARLGALLAATRGLAEARADTTADANADLRAPLLSVISFSFMSCTRFRFCRACSRPGELSDALGGLFDLQQVLLPS